MPALGHLLEGRLRMRTESGEETYEAGQAYCWAPGHVCLALEDGEWVESPPSGDLQRVIDHLASRAG
ncbi:MULTISPECIES: hypothetical protein [Streptomyces]|uniref:Uncharacterized protein n=1 Tax=Streptomyces fimbriatus TaxID=68197 RepID=A0ABW0D8X2_STRFI